MKNNIKSQDEIYASIVTWELNTGEALLDQGFDLNPLTFMTWCFGKGYINRDQYNSWVKSYKLNMLSATDANYFVYNSYNRNGEFNFAVVNSKEWNKEDQERAYRILSEFISEIDVYIERFEEFILS